MEESEATEDTVAMEAREAVEAPAAMPPFEGPAPGAFFSVTLPSATCHSSEQRADVNSAGERGRGGEGGGPNQEEVRV
jgi:hypothetical protein